MSQQFSTTAPHVSVISTKTKIIVVPSMSDVPKILAFVGTWRSRLHLCIFPHDYQWQIINGEKYF
jgi:hypothetical protein